MKAKYVSQSVSQLISAYDCIEKLLKVVFSIGNEEEWFIIIATYLVALKSNFLMNCICNLYFKI